MVGVDSGQPYNWVGTCCLALTNTPCFRPTSGNRTGEIFYWAIRNIAIWYDIYNVIHTSTGGSYCSVLTWLTHGLLTFHFHSICSNCDAAENTTDESVSLFHRADHSPYFPGLIARWRAIIAIKNNLSPHMMCCPGGVLLVLWSPGRPGTICIGYREDYI